MSYTYKVGDKGKTEGDYDYEVVDILSTESTKPVVVLIDGGQVVQVGADGLHCHSSDTAGSLNLTPPKQKLGAWVAIRSLPCGRKYISGITHQTKDDARKTYSEPVITKYIEVEV